MKRLYFFLSSTGLLLLAFLPVEIYHGNESVHDIQRAGQIVIIFIMAAVGALMVHTREMRFPRWEVTAALALVISLGLISSLISLRPLWGVIEVATFVGCLNVFFVMSTASRNDPNNLESSVIKSVFISCFFIFSHFVFSYLSASIGGLFLVDPWLLIGGFDNLRFFAQFCIFALPVLALPLMGGSSKRCWPWMFIGAWWGLLIFSGSRGAWISMALVIAFFSIFRGAPRRWASIQIRAALLGGGFFLIIVNVIPGLLGAEVSHHPAERLVLSSSGRTALWGQALAVWVQHPLMGIGPMQLAGVGPSLAAHPHQLVLQWAAEWGGISLTIMLGVGLYGLHQMVKHLRGLSMSQATSDLLFVCMSAGVFGALALSLIDGVFVMPVSQLWFAVMTGCLAGACYRIDECTHSAGYERNSAWIQSLLAISAAFFLIAILLRDWPPSETWSQRADSDSSLVDPMQPRFWLRGRIENK